MGTIHHLSTSALTPEVLLHQILNRRDVRGVVIVVQNEDETMDCCWTRLTFAELCMAAKRLDMDVTKWVDQSLE